VTGQSQDAADPSRCRAARRIATQARCRRWPSRAGYKGPLYGTPALLNADFVRVGGKAVEGVQVSAAR